MSQQPPNDPWQNWQAHQEPQGQQPPEWQPNTSYPSNPQWPPQQPSQPLSPPPQYTQYPPPPPPYYPPPYQQPPPTQTINRRGCLALGLIALIVLIGVGISNISTVFPSSTASSPTPTQASQSNATTAPTDTPVPTDTPAPTDTPTPAPQLTWQTTHNFTGSGIKKTGIFSVASDWKIQWKCDPSSFYGSQYNVQVYVYASDNSIQDVAINEICKSGNTNGETEEHQGGSVYLDINSEGSWSITLQELK